MTARRLMAGALLALVAGSALAGAGGGGGLAWEAPLVTITNSFTGPVAFAASSIAVVTTLATLAFADNLSGAGRTLVYMVLVIAALIGVVQLLATLFAAGASLSGSPVTRLWLVSAAALAAACALAWAELRLAAVARRLIVRGRTRRCAVSPRVA